MTTAVGYASSSDFGVHFGLGAAAAIGTIEVRWPSGVTQTIDQAKPDHVLVIDEKK